MDFNSIISPLGSFVFGHEAGHKLLAVKSYNSVNSVIEEASMITGINHKGFLEEILCDEAGFLVSNSDYVRFPFSYYKRKALQRLMLKLAWE